MNNSPKIESKQISICFSQDQYDSLQKLSAKRKIPLAAVVRECVDKGTAVEYFAAEQDLIRGYIRDEVKVVLDKHLERVIKLQLKATQSSAVAMFASLRVLTDMYADDLTFENVLALAHKEAHAYMKLKEQPFEYHLEEARKLLDGAFETTNPSDM